MEKYWVRERERDRERNIEWEGERQKLTEDDKIKKEMAGKERGKERK